MFRNKWIKWLLGLALVVPSLGQAQNSFYTDRAVGVTPIQSTSVLAPIAYGQVRVCTINATGSPCVPTASIFDLSGNPLSVSGGNFGQLTTDVVGRFSFGCTPGSYIVQVAGSFSNVPQLTYPITCTSTVGGLPPVNLATGVTGILPLLNGGTGSATGVNLASAVFGVLPIANGGTGQTSVGTANQVVHGGNPFTLSSIAQGDVTNGFVDLSTNQTSIGGNKSFFSISVPKVIRDARQDGVVCDGVTEDGVNINTALTNAVAAQQSIVVLPAGTCKVSTSLNMTNRSGLKLRGGGMGNHTETPVGLTKILCNTGTSPCIDRTGSSEGALEELTLNILNTFSTPSQVAILMGRDNAAGGGAGPFCFSQFNHDTHLQIETDSNLTLNSGQGYVGIYDINAELYSIEDSDIIANTPAWFDTANTLAISSAYQTLQTGCSASMTGVTSKNTGWTGEGNGVNQIFNIQGSPTGDFRFTQTFLGWAVSSGCNAGGQFAIRTGTGTIFSLVVDETTDYEQNCAPGGFLFANGNIKHSQIHPQTAVPNGTSAWFIPGNGTTWTDVDFSITKANAGDTTQNLLGNVNTVTITGSTLRANETLSPISLSNVTLTGDTVVAPGFTPSNVTFNSASTYTLQSSAGTSIIGPLTADASTGRVTKYNALAVNQTGSIGVVPQLCWVSRTGQVAAITTTTVPGCSSVATQTLYMVNADVSCNTSSAGATATLTVGWTDESNTAQTAANTATCTTLGASSHASFYQVFTAKSATNITYAVGIANTPTYDVRVSITQLGTN